MANAWGVEVNGPDQDRAILPKILRPPFDPYVEQVENDHESYSVLRSSAFDGISNASEVHRSTVGLFSTLNAVMSQNVDVGVISPGAVVEFVADGPARRHHFLKAETIVLRIRVGLAELTLKDANGNPVPPPLKPTVAQNWMRAATLEPEIGNALRYLEGDPGWVELYKAYEALGGVPNGGLPKAEVQRFTQTANVGNRHHANSKWKPHKRPMALWEARAFISKWICAGVADVLANNP